MRIFQSTHKFSARQYLAVFFTLTLATLVLSSILAIKVLFFDQWFGYQYLLAFQKDKVKKSTSAETIFVGDSSLGNAIDAKLFSQLSGENSLNLALTGNFGYAGSYNMIKQVRRKHRIKNVVLFQTLNSLKRGVSYRGYLETMGSWDDFKELAPREKGALVKTFYNVVLSPKNFSNIFRHYTGSLKRPAPITNDYIDQGKPLDPAVYIEPFNTNINEENSTFLKKIVAYCRQSGINLVYVHGPLWEVVGRESGEYIEKANALLAETGIELIKEPIFLSTEELGDSDDHVNLSFKKAYTEKYCQLLKPYLR